MGLFQEAQLAHTARVRQHQDDGNRSGSEVWPIIGPYRTLAHQLHAECHSYHGRASPRVQRQQSSFTLLQTLMQPLASSAGTVGL